MLQRYNVVTLGQIVLTSSNAIWSVKFLKEFLINSKYGMNRQNTDLEAQGFSAKEALIHAQHMNIPNELCISDAKGSFFSSY